MKKSSRLVYTREYLERWLPARGWSALGGSGQKQMYYVYLLKSEKTSKVYKGSTADLQKRFYEHNSGKTPSTKLDRPWKLIYYEAFTDKRNARREELFLKGDKGRERIKWLFKND